MRSNGRGRAGRMRWRPTLEGMEARALLSGVVVASMTPRPAVVHARAGGQGGGTSGGTGQGGIDFTDASRNLFLNPTPTGTTAVPTPHELARQHVRFVFSGTYQEGPGRYSNIARTIYIRGLGTSKYFLHGDIQVGIVVPTDPTSNTYGASTSFDRNINANSAFGFDLVGAPGAVDRGGRPNVLTAVPDQNTSAGLFGEALGTGTMTIRYFPSGNSGRGRATVAIVGDYYTLGTNNIFGVIGRSANNSSAPDALTK